MFNLSAKVKSTFFELFYITISACWGYYFVKLDSGNIWYIMIISFSFVGIMIYRSFLNEWTKSVK